MIMIMATAIIMKVMIATIALEILKVASGDDGYDDDNGDDDNVDDDDDDVDVDDVDDDGDDVNDDDNNDDDGDDDDDEMVLLVTKPMAITKEKTEILAPWCNDRNAYNYEENENTNTDKYYAR